MQVYSHINKHVNGYMTICDTFLFDSYTLSIVMNIFHPWWLLLVSVIVEARHEVFHSLRQLQHQSRVVDNIP